MDGLVKKLKKQHKDFKQGNWYFQRKKVARDQWELRSQR